jgi:pimeloyl-ACP methyl ester carboxylesterase
MTGTARRVATLSRVRIGEANQWISLRSDDLRNPIVLYLHGGPGASQLTSNRRHTRELEKHFTVVDWDQRGAGKSYAAIEDVGRMTIDQIVDDARELTVHLRNRFQQERIVLVGHSWGSVIGALAAAKYPDLFHCYVGIGQVANMADGEAASYRWTLEEAQRRDDRRAVRALTAMGPPPYTGDWRRKTIRQRRYVAAFGGEIHGSRAGAMGIVLRSLLRSREYGLADRINLFRGLLGSMKLLWPQLLKINLFDAVPELKLPVIILAGRFDHEVPSEVAARYFDALRAPSKELIWFERSAHMPQFEEPELFTRMMVEKVLPLTNRSRNQTSFSSPAGVPSMGTIRPPR